MITVHIRKQGGAAVITIPSNVLKMLDIGIGAEMTLEVSNKKMVARPVFQISRKRYSLAELLRGTTTQKMKLLNKKTEWARTGKPMGREKL